MAEFLTPKGDTAEEVKSVIYDQMSWKYMDLIASRGEQTEDQALPVHGSLRGDAPLSKTGGEK